METADLQDIFKSAKHIKVWGETSFIITSLQLRNNSAALRVCKLDPQTENILHMAHDQVDQVWVVSHMTEIQNEMELHPGSHYINKGMYWDEPVNQYDYTAGLKITTIFKMQATETLYFN
jgi:uncharacterized protein YigE (DUF2233 family)